MTGAILDVSHQEPVGPVLVDACVIGSGPSGATAAWELALAGREVLVLEEGGDLTGSALTGRDGAMYDQLYMDRGGRATEDMGMSVLQGRALGGGSVINECDVVPVSDGVLRYWQARFGLGDLGPEQIAPFRDRALKDLSASLPRDDLFNENNRILQRGAAQLGWRGEVMLHNRVGCVGLGLCLLGCPLDRKRNARFVAIPAAQEAGARFFTRARATRISGAGGEIKTIEVQRLDGRGYRVQGALEVRARTVVLAANAVASAQLLLRSGLGNDHVGRHLSLQPQLPILGRFGHQVRLFRGAPQSYAVTEFERPASADHGLGGFRIEGIGSTPGLFGSMLPTFGEEGRAEMMDFSRLAAALLLTPDEGTGQVHAEASGRVRIEYALDGEQKGRLRDAVRAATRLYLAAGAQEVLVPSVPSVRFRSEKDLRQVDQLSFAPASVALISAHQQGTVRMAPSEKDGGADPGGQVYGTRGVYVLDGSGFPSSVSSHTMAPNITFARYLARKLVAGTGG